MNKIIFFSFVILIGIGTSIGLSSVMAQEESIIPEWIKTAFSFWVNDQISDQELLHAIQYFVENEMIEVPNENHNERIIENLHIYQSELSEKISKTRQLANNNILRLEVIESNQSFDNLNSVDFLIEQRDKEWVSSNPDEVTSFMQQLIRGEAGDVLQTTIIDDKNSESLVSIEEIIVTNSYGANVVISGKTSDYYQADERWWTEAKQHGTFISEGHFDESVGVFATDISVHILDDDGNFIGVLKSVINVETIIES